VKAPEARDRNRETFDSVVAGADLVGRFVIASISAPKTRDRQQRAQRVARSVALLVRGRA